MRKIKDNYHTYLLLAVLIIAAVFRLHQIGQPYVGETSWRETDNGTIADNFFHGNWNIFFPEISWNGPGHNYVGYEFQTVTYLAAMFYHIFGQHEWIGRCIAVAFSLWGIFAFYQLVRCAWTRNHALLSAAIIAIMPGAIYNDRCFMSDPVMLSLVTTSFWLLLVYLRSDKPRYLFLASLACMLGVLTKISGIFIGIPMLYAVISILKQRQKLDFKHLFPFIIAAIVVLVPVTAYYLWAIHISYTYPPFFIAATEYWVWTYGFKFFLEHKYFLPELYRHLSVILTRPLLLLVVAGIFFRPPPYRKAGSQKIIVEDYRKAPWLFHWWLLSLAVYYFIGAQGLVGNPNSLNLLNPVAAALAANLLIRTTSFIERKLKKPVSVALILAVLAIITERGFRARTTKFYSWDEKDYRMGLALRKLSEPTDLVITATATLGNTIAIYYSQRRGWQFPPAYSWATHYLNIPDSDAIPLLNGLISKGANWFGIAQVQLLQFRKNNPGLIQYLETKFDRYYESPDFTIYRIAPKN